MIRFFLFAAVILVTSCASQIMEGYVGRDIAEVAVERGPPSASFDMPDGRRAFQWTYNSSFVMPTTTTGTGYRAGNMYFANTQTTGGQVISSSCVYTLFAEQTGGRWVVVGFAPPRLC